jgi:hypothetical protein
MKHFLFSALTCSLLALAINNIMAQQGNVAAGGDAAGEGGSMSYSIGQTDYLTYSSASGSMSFGLQQTWFDMPLVLIIPDTTIYQDESLCFNAIETIIVAGDGKSFNVKPGGHADLIAGQNIIMHYGTSIEYSGTLHARISTNWCSKSMSLLANFEEEKPVQKHVLKPKATHSFLQVFPNPTTGQFTLELTEFDESSEITMEIYTMLGQLIFYEKLPVMPRSSFNLSDQQAGIYLLRIRKDSESAMIKLIKQ